jgi:hypothetical protein
MKSFKKIEFLFENGSHFEMKILGCGRREVLGDLRHILEAQGIQFPDIGGVTSDEECRSSFASIAIGGRP